MFMCHLFVVVVCASVVVAGHCRVSYAYAIEHAASRHRGIAASRHRGIAASRHRGIAASRHRGIAIATCHACTLLYRVLCDLSTATGVDVKHKMSRAENDAASEKDVR
jgi:hypothetical protein